MPFYIDSFKELSGLLANARDIFCGHMASIAIYGEINPIKGNGWLFEFVKTVNDKDRVTWAIELGRLLDHLNEIAITKLWGDWLSEYWQQRIEGIPVALTSEELARMVEWAPQLLPVLPQVIEKIRASGSVKLEHTFVYRDLTESHAPKQYPIPTAQLIEHLLVNAEEPFLHCPYIERIIRDLIDSGTPKDMLLKICNELARLGCRCATELYSLLKNRK